MHIYGVAFRDAIRLAPQNEHRRHSDNIAVVFENEKLTYAELNAKTNQLARKLRDSGVKPDDLVMILANRSVEMITAVYAVMKSGGAYVPVDPGYPKDRIEYTKRKIVYAE